MPLKKEFSLLNTKINVRYHWKFLIKHKVKKIF